MDLKLFEKNLLEQQKFVYEHYDIIVPELKHKMFCGLVSEYEEVRCGERPNAYNEELADMAIYLFNIAIVTGNTVDLLKFIETNQHYHTSKTILDFILEGPSMLGLIEHKHQELNVDYIAKFYVMLYNKLSPITGLTLSSYIATKIKKNFARFYGQKLITKA